MATARGRTACGARPRPESNLLWGGCGHSAWGSFQYNTEDPNAELTSRISLCSILRCPSHTRRHQHRTSRPRRAALGHTGLAHVSLRYVRGPVALVVSRWRYTQAAAYHPVISGCAGCCCTPPGSLPIVRSSPKARSWLPRQAPAAPPATALATAWPPRTRERHRLSLRW
eukprot:scaffold132538_cov69-Phaeocystis_antarctica.AAC.3